jgi:putative two-component system response regulator
LNASHKRKETVTDPVRIAMAVAAFAMTTLAETRDSGTGQHILRVQHYVRKLARHLKRHPRFMAVLTEPYINILFQSAPLYDMGTIGIPDRVLLKPSHLTLAEQVIMRSHTTLARDAIAHAERTLGYQAELLSVVKELVYSHQEKWNGTGYPQGISGDQIPVSARLIAIADVYDALITNRVYKQGVPHDQAVAIIFQQRASHFDPDMVDAFIEIQDEFQAIAQRYADTEQDMQNKIEYMANAIAEEAEIPVP